MKRRMITVKNVWKKAGALGTAAVLAASLAGCGTADTSGGAGTAGGESAADAGSTEQTVQQEQSAEESGEAVTLKAFTMGNEPASGMDTFYEQLDALTVKDLGIKVRFDFIPWGDEKNKINLNIASGEYDLYVGGNFSDYKVMATKNAFLDLKPLLSEVPDLVAHYSVVSDRTLESCEIGGKLYGIPQFGKATDSVAANEGFMYREDLRKLSLIHI